MSKNVILQKFNEIGATSPEPWNAQSGYLCGLISLAPLQRRRSRAASALLSSSHDCSFSYRVRQPSGNNTGDIQVHIKAFIALHGITKTRLETIKQSLKGGTLPKDKRGSHKNRPHKLTLNKLNTVCNHIKSFKGKFSHYSNTKSDKLYLPEGLTIKQMYSLYK